MTLPVPQQYRLLNCFNEKEPKASKLIHVPVRLGDLTGQQSVSFEIDLTSFTEQRKVEFIQGLIARCYFISSNQVPRPQNVDDDYLPRYYVEVEFEGGFKLYLPPFAGDDSPYSIGVETARAVSVNNPPRATVNVIATNDNTNTGLGFVEMDLYFTTFKLRPYTQTLTGSISSTPPPVLGILGTEVSDGPGDWGTQDGRAMLCIWPMIEDGLAQTLYVYFNPSAGVFNAKGLIYNADTGDQVAIGSTEEIPNPFPGGHIAFTFAGEALSNGVNYAIGAVCDDSPGEMGGGPPGVTDQNGLYQSLGFASPISPLPAPTATYSNTLGAYLEYEVV